MTKATRTRSVVRTALCGAAIGTVVLAGAPHAFAQTAPKTTDTEAVQEASAPEASGVSVTRVTLSTGGLAEVEGRMDEPDDAMRLAIERPQIADVLRTLVVTGPAPVVSVDLEAAEAVGERSVIGRLLAGDLADPATVLRSLVGEEVALTGGSNRLAGTLLAFESVRIPGADDAETAPGFRIAVATPEGRIAYATFPALEALAIEGDAVDERTGALVPAVGRSVDDGRRELTVTLGAEARAGLSFVVPTTVWRPSYRALVDDAGGARLQGWATLENTTGLDWEGIELRLAVGTPVAYTQDVYAPLRNKRPVAPFEVGETARVDIVPPSPRRLQRPRAGALLAAPETDAMAESSFAAPEPVAGLQTGGPAVTGSASSVFPVAGRIDLAAGRTLSVPFLDADEGVERIAYLDLDRPGAEPLDALEMSFDGEATVPGGLVAVFDARGFAGDARFAGSDGGETSILPFAASTGLDATVLRETSSEVLSASLRDGTLVLTRELRATTRFAFEADAPTVLVADGARARNAELSVETEGDIRSVVRPLDANRFRMRAELPEGASGVTLLASQPIEERYVVTDLPTPIVEEVLSLGESLDADVRARLAEVARQTARVVELDRAIATTEADIADLRETLAIDRENLEAIDVRTPEGARVRQRIVERSNLLDAALGELRELRRQRLAAQASLRPR